MASITKLTADHYAKSGMALFKKNLPDAALACFRKALAVNEEIPGELPPANYAYLVGNILWQLKRFDEALIYLERCWMLDKHYAAPLHILANLYANIGEFDSADEMFRAARKLARAAGLSTTDIELDYALFKLFVGRYDEGFAEFEIRRTYMPAAYIDTIPQWDGEDISTKTLYVYAEQGVGDTIQFARFLPHLKTRCRRLIFGAPPELIPLFRAYPEAIIDELVPRLLETPSPAADVCLPLVSAARFFPLSSDPGFFRDFAKAQDFDLIAPADERDLKIGIVWSGNPTHSRDRERSLALELLLPIAAMRGVQLYSLQVGQRSGEVDLIGAQTLIYQLTPELTSWATTASAMMKLDLVISVDTAVAHLAGALDVPVWLLLPTTPDWRWGPDGETTHWYESMRLWRQESIGDWKGIIAKMVIELGTWTELRRQPGADEATPDIDAQRIEHTKWLD